MKLLYLLVLINLYLSDSSSRTLHLDGILREPKSDLQMKRKQENDAIIWTKVETKSDLDEINSSHEEKLISGTSTGQENDLTIKNWETKSPFSVHDPMGNDSKDSSNSSSFSDPDNSSVLTEQDSGNTADVSIFHFDDGNESQIVIESGQLELINFNGTYIIVEDLDSFQEASTFGFEFLIETTNSLISDLLISRNTSIMEDLSDELSSLLKDWKESILENENLGASLMNEDALTLSRTENRNMNDFGFTGSEQNAITEKITPVCPEPGWCFFWLFSEDTCAEDHHCLGSRICCKLGCVKTCIDV